MCSYSEIKDSGERQNFDTGAKRDTQDGKPRFDLIPLIALYRQAKHYTGGAVKYDEWNWAKGMPISRFFTSMFRHMFLYAVGDKTEDHLAAVCFNANSIMHFEELIKHKPELSYLDDIQERLPHCKELMYVYENIIQDIEDNIEKTKKVKNENNKG